jgi:hypothetical protein
MVSCPLPPFAELVHGRSADDGQCEQGLGAMSSIDAMIRLRGGYFGCTAVRHRIGRRRGAERVPEEIGPLAAHIDEVIGVFSDFLAEILDAASPGFSGLDRTSPIRAGGSPGRPSIQTPSAASRVTSISLLPNVIVSGR